MKNFVLLLSILISTTLLSQENKSWRIGLTFGGQANSSVFSGGMSDANALFQRNDAGCGAFDLVARYDYNQRWMLLSGLGVNSYGFEFALSHNYSLLNPFDRFNVLGGLQGAALEIPFIVNYKFGYSCDKRAHGFVGIGYIQNYMGMQSVSQTFTDNEGANTNSLKGTASFKQGFYPMLRLTCGSERVFKRGAILNFALLWNFGFSELAHANVSYTVDGKDYYHEFKNSGNFFGMRISYFFRPLGVANR